MNVLLGLKTENENIVKNSQNSYQVDFSLQEKKISLVFYPENNSISSLKIHSKYEMQFEETMPVTGLRIILANVATYEVQIEKFLQKNSNLNAKEIIINTTKKSVKIGNQAFSLQ